MIRLSAYPSLSIRIWRARPWNANPLMRVTDRFESLIRVLAVVVILVAVPTAAAAGGPRDTLTQRRGSARTLRRKSLSRARLRVNRSG